MSADRREGVVPGFDDAYRDILDLARRPDAAQAIVDYLHDRFPAYSWVGLYWVEGGDLVLGEWRGPQATRHTRIPIGTGICGAAAASGRTEVVPDVSRDPRYLACFPSTRSEIVVPIVDGGRVVGEIDIDSTVPNAFGAEDQRFLERVAAVLAEVRRRQGARSGTAPPGS
ncbi:MAG: GAF domain-containing protein [Armatimonadota bacterium]|nr:GAF domain-containing protein [Armatimonadota bacterium]MDR7402896.1 GAF domain-containing protein [Armatimonadota bacterium]MDR7404796.1 GAF domain-containing protein [Armatimonadota bacterium]MDR7436131.1 GAF domain-containing protein [Armatimonadota bacterium]MDR7472010.1 GAF domain-containing protein [Armatimonadota bacterium]